MNSLAITPIVIAAGGGSRFGCPKALAEWNGNSFLTIISQALERLAAIERLTPIRVVIGAQAKRVQQQHRGLSLSWIVNESWEETEMIDSIRLGIAGVQGAALIWMVDCPHQSIAAIQALLAASRTSPGLAWLPISPAGLRGHPLLLAAQAVRELQDVRPLHLRAYFDAAGPRLIEVPVMTEAVARNLNTAQALTALEGKPYS